LTIDALREAGLDNPIHSAAAAREARSYLSECVSRARAGDDGLPCVILLDLRLPDASGLELLAEIKQDPVLRPVPVVILTTSENPPDVREAYRLGANSYLVKPVRFDDFHRKVREAGLYWALLNQSCDP
jgi:two-component system response regulator